MKKVLLGVAAVIAIGLGAGGWYLYSERDNLIADAIRKYAPDILGVPVKLGGVKTDFAEQSATLNGLVIGNPPGFKTAHALSVKSVSMKLDVNSLTKDVIVIRDISVLQPEIAYEQKSGGSNFDVIQRNAEKFAAEHTDGKLSSDKKGPPKKFIIERFNVTGAKAEVSAEILQGKSLTAPVPDIHLTDIGKKSNGATAGEAAKQIVGALTASVTRAASSLMSGAVDTVKKGAESVGGKLKGLLH